MAWTTIQDTSRGVDNRQMTHLFNDSVTVITDFAFNTIKTYYGCTEIDSQPADKFADTDAYLELLISIDEKASKLTENIES